MAWARASSVSSGISVVSIAESAGCDLRHVQILLGLRSLGSTQAYLKRCKESLRQVVDAAHPRKAKPVQLSKTCGSQLKASTVNNRFAVIRVLYTCLYRAGLTEGDPAQQLIDPLPVEASMRRPLTEAEVKAFLYAIDVTTAQGLKVGDVDFTRRVIRVRGKGDKDRLVPLSEVARYTHVVTDNLKRTFRRYHPREQALFAEVDQNYREWVKSLIKNRDGDTLSDRVSIRRTGGESEA